MTETGKMTARDGIDFIGDVHGRREELEALLDLMRYRRHDGAWRSPPARKAVFVGDLVDRGDDVPGVLALVKAMHDAGEAEVLLGNHEFNILCHYTSDGNGGFLRPHAPRKSACLAKTRECFDANPGEKAKYLKWFRSLPVCLDFGAARTVHAYWGSEELALLGTRRTLDHMKWGDVRFRKTSHGKALELLIKGPEIPLPDAARVPDRYGISRRDMRVAWWRREAEAMYVSLSSRPAPGIPAVPLPESAFREFEFYPSDGPLLVIGHYGFKDYPGPLASNVACVDYESRSAGIGAYRWSGESTVNEEHYVK